MGFNLYSILPAMWIKDALTCGPVVFCTTKHLEAYPIEPREDAKGVARVARQFRDLRGEPLDRLGLSLVATDSVEDAAREGLPRMCRDALALCHITAGTMRNCQHKARTAVCNWDYFEALPIRFRHERLLIDRPGLGAIVRFADYQPTLATHLGTPRECEFVLDQYLFAAFNGATRAVLQGRRLRELRQLFRSVALAVQATRLFRETYTQDFDLTPHVVAWTAAFETLVHGTDEYVGLNEVLDLVARIRWRDPSSTKVSACRTPAGGLTDATPPVMRKTAQIKHYENAPSAFYRRLHQLRNDLAHGNRIDSANFPASPGTEDGWRVDEIAPLLFRECVLERFRDLGIITRVRDGEVDDSNMRLYVEELLATWDYHESFADAIAAADAAETPVADGPGTHPAEGDTHAL